MTSEIIYILDRSGSMQTIWDDAFNGLNQFILDQKALEREKCYFQLTVFDNEIYDLLEMQPIDRVDILTPDMVSPRGATALLDAMGSTIETARDNQRELDMRPDKTSVIVMTDGRENASQKYTRERVNNMVRQQRHMHGWDFIFMGADMDAFSEGLSLGIPRDKVHGWEKSKDGTRIAVNFASQSTTSYRGGD